MGPKKFTFAVITMLAALMLALLFVIVWAEMSARASARSALLINIGEIKRIDEVLTNSAMLATVTGESMHRERYYDHVTLLDDLFVETMALFDSERARETLENTQAANHTLVAIETEALNGMNTGPNPDGYSSLRSSMYLKNKHYYLAGVENTFAILRELAEKQTRFMRIFMVCLSVALVVSFGFLFRLLLKTRLSHAEHAHQQALVVAMQSTINSFMDIQNNLLNNMIFFRTKATHNLPFDAEEIKLIDTEIDNAKIRLAHIARTGIGTTRDLGGIVVCADEAEAAPPDVRVA